MYKISREAEMKMLVLQLMLILSGLFTASMLYAQSDTTKTHHFKNCEEYYEYKARQIQQIYYPYEYPGYKFPSATEKSDYRKVIDEMLERPLPLSGVFYGFRT